MTIFERGGACARLWGEGQREQKSQADSVVSIEPDVGSISWFRSWDHDLNPNQESDTQPTAPPWGPDNILYPVKFPVPDLCISFPPGLRFLGLQDRGVGERLAYSALQGVLVSSQGALSSSIRYPTAPLCSPNTPERCHTGLVAVGDSYPPLILWGLEKHPTI